MFSSQAELYTGGLPEYSSNDYSHGKKLHQKYRHTLNLLENIMAGYTFPEEVSSSLLVKNWFRFSQISTTEFKIWINCHFH